MNPKRTAARIVLVRHGPSSHVDSPWAIDRPGVEAWRGAYDSAGILSSSRPPGELLELVADAAHVVASDLRRAIESAERLAPEREIRVSELLRESPLPIPRWPTRLPLMAWGVAMHLEWSYRILRGMEVTAAERERAASAAEMLIDLVADGSTAVVVTHGVFRRMIGGQLAHRRWTSAGRVGGYGNWSSWSYTPPP